MRRKRGRGACLGRGCRTSPGAYGIPILHEIEGRRRGISLLGERGHEIEHGRAVGEILGAGVVDVVVVLSLVGPAGRS